MKIIMKRSESPRADACLRVRGDRNIEALTVSTFSGDLMGRGTSILRFTVVAVWLNVVTHVTIDFWSRTGTDGAKLK